MLGDFSRIGTNRTIRETDNARSEVLAALLLEESAEGDDAGDDDGLALSEAEFLVAVLMQMKFYMPGEYLIHEQVKPLGLFSIEKGSVDVFKLDKDKVPHARATHALSRWSSRRSVHHG